VTPLHPSPIVGAGRQWAIARWAVGAASVCAYVLVCLASVDGALSGDDHFSLWIAAAVAAGDRPDIDVFDPGSPLQWWMSYLGQRLTGGRTIGEVALAITFKTVGLVAVFHMTRRLVGRWDAAWAATVVVSTMLLAYHVYGWEKVFIYPVSVLAAMAYLEGRARPWLLGCLAAMAGLLRHDHGLYVGLFLGAAVLSGPRPRLRSFLVFAACAVAIYSPWLWWIARTEGLVEYLRARVGFSSGLGLLESRPLFQFVFPLWSFDGAVVWTWHIALAVPLAAFALGLVRRHVALMLTAALLLVLEAGIMRQGLQVKETAILWVPLFACLLFQVRRGVGAWVVRATAIVLVVTVPIVTGAPERLSGLVLRYGGLFTRAAAAVRYHSKPRQLDDYAPPTERNERLIVRYAALCLTDADRIWDTSDWFPLSYYSGRRPVWHTYWSLGFLRDDASQRTFLRWIEQTSAPVIVVRRGRPDPVTVFDAYPLIKAYVAERYREVASPELEAFVKEGNRMELLVDRGRTASSVFEPLGLPCFTK
jgi:hypothetical protein